jgi:predicted kinase
MFNVCAQCGIYDEEKHIDPSGPWAICPHCNHAHRFVQLPLFVLTGASGAGKSSVCLHLPWALPECVCLESDILWRSEFATPDDNYRSYRNMWLRVAKNVAQAGRPVVLCGTALPDQFEACPERRYFTQLHYLALVCDDDLLAARLRARPAWRGAGGDAFVDTMTAFNRWIKANAATTQPPMSLLDTTASSVEQSVAHVAAWVRERLASERD